MTLLVICARAHPTPAAECRPRSFALAGNASGKHLQRCNG